MTSDYTLGLQRKVFVFLVILAKINGNGNGLLVHNISLTYICPYGWIGHPVQTPKKPFFARPRGLCTCGRFEYTYEKLHVDKSHPLVRKKYVLSFRTLFLKIGEMPHPFPPHSWMRLLKIPNAEVSGASEVSQSHGKLFF